MPAASLPALMAAVFVCASSAAAETRDVITPKPAADGACTVIRPERPAWLSERRATLVVDSVLLGGVPALKANLAGWKVTQRGRPAVMLPAIESEVAAAAPPVAPLAIVGVGYNSLWQRGRVRYEHWAAAFDRQARELATTLRRRGAQQIVWVTLRQANRSVISPSALWQYDDYAWYFPYVNERLRRLDRRRGDLVLADWAAVSNRPGVTYDAIHLNPEGQRLMARTIRRAIEQEAARQVSRQLAGARAACASAASHELRPKRSS